MEERLSVSVVIPTFNRASFLQCAIDSVLSQTFDNFELVIVDDGSTDGTKTLVESYCDPRIRFLSTNNQGPARARNIGIENAKGDLVAFLDSDDCWFPEKLERQVTLLNSEIGLVYCSVLIGRNWDEAKILSKAQYRGNCFPFYIENPGVAIIGYGCSTVLVRKSLLLSVGAFDENIPSPAEDYDLFLRLSNITKVDFIEEPLAFYRVHETNISGHLDSYVQANLFVLRKVVKSQNMNRVVTLKYLLKYSYSLIKPSAKALKIGLVKAICVSVIVEFLNLLRIQLTRQRIG